MRHWIRYSFLFALFALWWGCSNPTPPTQEQAGEKGAVDTNSGSDASVAEGATDTTTPPPDISQPDVSVPDAAPTDNGPGPEPAPVDEPVGPMTYHKDIRPILESNCLNCHKKGGVGPFLLTEYRLVYAQRNLVKLAVGKRRMPPWQADKTCKEYSNDISLTDLEIKKIVSWVDQGAPEGDEKDYKAPPPPQTIGLTRIDATVKMKKAYKPKGTDDYRCFVFDWDAKTTKYITGFQIKPGTPQIVHHVIAYRAKASDAARYVKKDPNGDGYTCYGTAGGPAGLNWIGIWAPGVPGSNYPAGTGIKIEPGAKIIVQLHYNTSPQNKDLSDQTSVDFKLEDKVDKEAIFFPYTNPDWLRNTTDQKGMYLPAGQKDIKHQFNFSLSLLNFVLPELRYVHIYKVTLHMHELGTQGKLSVWQNGQEACLLNVPRWDFGWQLSYHLKKPVLLDIFKDKVGISCTWDNTQANQRYVDGKQSPPKDVYWGDGTSDEMCLGIVYITCEDKTNTSIACPDLSNLFRGNTP